jgi:catechol 2,3-dioxygenase-like lactoylglutathione lyase family enzyme
MVIRYGFDHVVLAVRDLDEAVRQYTQLGFNVEPGGRHPGFGTANALIQLDNGYIELLAVEDAAVALAAGVRRREVVEFLDQRPGGLIGYALTCDSLERVRLRGGRAEPRLDLPPLQMSRVRPDGSTVQWRLLVPGGSTWCRPWPFLIEWEASGQRAVAGGRPEHPNGAVAVDSLVVGTSSLSAVSAFFEENVGLIMRGLPEADMGSGRRAGLDVGGCTLDFVELTRSVPGPLTSTVEGEGPVALRIRVRSLKAASRMLATNGIQLVRDGRQRWSVSEAFAAGAKLALFDEQ